MLREAWEEFFELEVFLAGKMLCKGKEFLGVEGVEIDKDQKLQA